MGQTALQVRWFQSEPPEVFPLTSLGLGQDDVSQQRRLATLAEHVQRAVEAARVTSVILVPPWTQLLFHSESRQPKPSWHPLTCSQ